MINILKQAVEPSYSFSVESLCSSSPECWEFLTVSENVILEQKSKCFLDNLIICRFSA